ncbi:inositol monophosphatase family protein [Catenuloplanes atrovinosus]|uniref:Myo-inositol-1(Or 4)-monophosphatase n=1 Tax=Catenuloplanes atrovinosus TaxID=137266 RepID=A0AAE3YSD6_9ACTN|nr:inositol monophosphatase family protein [Catenuloplanes atrovinosus]MDR7278347.1 myo-inositol-1(or 4)-monophosphatase [Catenuloplanes atrovinosus]
MSAIDTLLPAAHEAVDLARDLMRTMLPGVLTAKGDRDMASEVDLAIEQRVRAFLAERTPGVGFLGEEEGARGARGGLTWSLDPVDGTVNFVHGSPICAVSLGLIEDDRSVLGVIDLPFLGNRYWASPAGGAFCDGAPIRASGVSELPEALVAVGDFAVGEDADAKNRERFAILEALVPRIQRVRMLGSAATDLAWLAAGRLDALVMLSNKPWDTSAGTAIAYAAGARVVDRDGSDHTFRSSATIACAPGLADELLPLLAGVL